MQGFSLDRIFKFFSVGLALVRSGGFLTRPKPDRPIDFVTMNAPLKSTAFFGKLVSYSW